MIGGVIHRFIVWGLFYGVWLLLVNAAVVLDKWMGLWWATAVVTGIFILFHEIKRWKRI